MRMRPPMPKEANKGKSKRVMNLMPMEANKCKIIRTMQMKSLMPYPILRKYLKVHLNRRRLLARKGRAIDLRHNRWIE